MAFTWELSQDLGATVRGSWGTSFRFANAGEYSTVLSDSNQAWNLPSESPIPIPCTGGAPAAGSTAQALVAAGFACGSGPGGITWAGGPQAVMRGYINGAGLPASREGGTALAPETSTNYSIGFELAPQMEFLRGLDIQATWYSVKVNNTLLGFNSTSSQTLADPLQRFHMILPSDLGCSVASNANPASASATKATSSRNSSPNSGPRSCVPRIWTLCRNCRLGRPALL